MSPGFEPADVSNCDNKMMGKVPPEPRERILEEGQGRPGGGLVVSTSVASGGGGHSFSATIVASNGRWEVVGAPVGGMRGGGGGRVTEDLVAAWSWDTRLRGAWSDVHC